MDWREKKEKSRAGESGSSETSEEPVVIIEHNYFEGEDGGNDICHIAKKEVVLSREDEEMKDQWHVGRQFVDLGIIADGLKSCQLYGQPLHLSDCVCERKFGLSHGLIVKCNFLEMSSPQRSTNGQKTQTTSEGYAWDVNTKLAASNLEPFQEK